jgi:hypothetical protein
LFQDEDFGLGFDEERGDAFGLKVQSRVALLGKKDVVGGEVNQTFLNFPRPHHQMTEATQLVSSTLQTLCLVVLPRWT